MGIWKNIKWLFNNPPVNLQTVGKVPPCDYCGTIKSDRWHVVGVYCICERCRKNVFDSVLKQQK